MCGRSRSLPITRQAACASRLGSVSAQVRRFDWDRRVILRKLPGGGAECQGDPLARSFLPHERHTEGQAGHAKRTKECACRGVWPHDAPQPEGQYQDIENKQICVEPDPAAGALQDFTRLTVQLRRGQG
jgi:hypothetical protein